jgi:hypothetical protein
MKRGFERWSTPKGEYWIPKGSHFVLPFNLAEQERDIYTGTEVRVKPGRGGARLRRQHWGVYRDSRLTAGCREG